MEEKKYGTCPECGAPCEVIEGSYKEELHDVYYVEHKYSPQQVAASLNHDRVIANQVAGMPLEEAIFQAGYSAGVEFEKNRERTGAVVGWVGLEE